MASRKHVTQKDIDLVKALLGSSISKSKICEISDKSWGVINYIDETDGTLADYKRLAKERNAKYQRKTAAPLDGTAAIPQPNTNGIHNSLQALNTKVEHLETQMQELIDNTSAVNAMLGKKKLIW